MGPSASGIPRRAGRSSRLTNVTSGEVVTAAYSPDGLWVASGGTDRTVRVWGAANRHDVAVLHGHTGVVSELAFTADGRRLASASQSGRAGDTGDGTVRIWEVGRQADTSVLRGHTSYIYPVAYSPDGRWIASGSWDNTVRLWDAATGESCAILPHAGVCARAGLQPGQHVVGLRMRSGRIVAHLERRDRASSRKSSRGPGRVDIQAIAVSPDGARIAAADADGSATIVEAATGAEVHSFRMAAAGIKRSLAYSPDGRLLAGTGEDGTQIDIWDTQTLRIDRPG